MQGQEAEFSLETAPHLRARLDRNKTASLGYGHPCLPASLFLPKFNWRQTNQWRFYALDGQATSEKASEKASPSQYEVATLLSGGSFPRAAR